MIDFCILGSGIAGSTIANLLSKKYSVEVFDKARGSGGRSSNKKFNNNLSFDHGVQYISPKTKEFKNYIDNLHRKKILKYWDGAHIDLTLNSNSKKLKYIGKLGNNDICKYQLKKIKQNYLSHIIKIEHKKKIWEITLKDNTKYQFRSLVLTCPYPQLKKLAKKYLIKRMLNLNVKMQPNITLMLAIQNQKKIPINSIKLEDNILAWIANENSKKRFKSNINLWTLQGTLKWSKKNINLYKKNKKIVNQIEAKFLKFMCLNKKDIIYKKIHGWKYSYNYSKTSLQSYWNSKIALGVCGDWFIGPKVENAWQSACDLSKKIKKNPLILNKRV